MNTMSIAITFLILWMGLSVGLLMVTIAILTLRPRRATVAAWAGTRDQGKRGYLPLSLLLLGIGLFLSAWAAFGAYRLIWIA